MARITVLPESDTLGTVDVNQLLQGRGELPSVDPKTQVPTSIRCMVVHEDPKITVVPQFFSPAECDHLTELAEGNWIRSLVGQLVRDEPKEASAGYVESKTDKVQSATARTRTSSSCSIRPGQTAIVQRLENRLAQLAKLPVETLERLVVVRYAPGQQFSVHHDGKFRPITVFVYLNELPEGAAGDTFFPHLGMSFIPRKGCAVMWPNALPDGSEDSRMVHAGRPPLSGVKFGVNCFFNIEEKRHLLQPSRNVPCADAYVVDLDTLGGGRQAASSSSSSTPRRAFSLDTKPQLRAVPGFATSEEVEHLLGLLQGAKPKKQCTAFEGGTVVLCGLKHAQTDEVASLEERLASWAGFPLEHTGQLRLVQGNTTLGLANRGCGQRFFTLALSEQDELYFPQLGIRVALRRGDLLEWPNAWFQAPSTRNPSEQVTVEDLSTLFVHLVPEGGAAPFALQASFHDTVVRQGEEPSSPAG